MKCQTDKSSCTWIAQLNIYNVYIKCLPERHNYRDQCSYYYYHQHHHHHSYKAQFCVIQHFKKTFFHSQNFDCLSCSRFQSVVYPVTKTSSTLCTVKLSSLSTTLFSNVMGKLCSASINISTQRRSYFQTGFYFTETRSKSITGTFQMLTCLM